MTDFEPESAKQFHESSPDFEGSDVTDVFDSDSDSKSEMSLESKNISVS